MLMVAGAERRQRPGLDLDRDRWRGRQFIGRGRLWRRLRCQLRRRDTGDRREPKPRRRRFQEAAAGEMRWLIPHGAPKSTAVIPGGALARARNPYSRSWLWIPGSLVSLAPRNDNQECSLRRWLDAEGGAPWVSLNSSA